MKDLLLSLDGNFEDLHTAGNDHIKACSLIAFREDPLPLPAGTPHADPGQRLVLRLRKSFEKGHAGNLLDHIHHSGLLSHENKLPISLTYVKALFIMI
jgi:hypothetical protein